MISKRNPETIDRIIEAVSRGETLTSACASENLHRWTFYDWMKSDESLSQRFARARELGFDALADECIKIANSPQEGSVTTVDDKGISVRTEDMLGHRKLQIETRLKLLAKWDPKRYGDKIQHTGDGGGPIAVNVYIPDNGRDKP